MTWNKGFRQIVIEVDSLDVVRALQEVGGRTCTLLFHIQNLFCRGWEIRVLHVFCHGNSDPNCITKLASSDSTHVTYFEDPLSSVVQLLQHDVTSISTFHSHVYCLVLVPHFGEF
ncbi:hypothetical protein GQ457_02G018100 [Hibiscus cannabinus]